MFDKIFGWNKKKQEPGPDILFGRYSDNNKSLPQVNRWTEADNLFKEKKYPESFDAFFEYLRDEEAQNVVYERNGAEGRFQVYQGSKIVRGTFDKDQVKAEVSLAKMPQPSIPVMRRLLEMNFSLYYSRFALDNEVLSMQFDSQITSANPSKLYYGLKELATKADKQDDLLVQDFAVLQTVDREHILEIPAAEKEVKYEYLQKWVKFTLDTIAGLDADKFSGGISYMLLSLVYRIDYLIKPEGTLLNDLEKIAGIYFKKDEKQPVERNRDMIDEFKRISERTKEDVFLAMFRSRHTFSIVTPQVHKVIADSIAGANQNMLWYRDNNHPYIGTQVIEYGISYCQYSYSMPRAITELFHLYMQVNYSDYFATLGFKESYFNPATNQFNVEGINSRIIEIQQKWKAKYPNMDFKLQQLRFDNLITFDHTFSVEIQNLNMDAK
ncbi:MAG: hypothetical protein ABI480_15170 [Chitinophagaceae bacterium]